MSSRPEIDPFSTADFLMTGGEMGRLLRTYPWSNSPLGAPDHWQQPLKTLASVMLTAADVSRMGN
jgi:hypothetical protein